eukprot:1707954-Amphidinium_carterae.1
MACLDRFFIRAPLPVVQEWGCKVKVLSIGEPPCGGDHHPVQLQWIVRKWSSPGGVARWMETHP